MARCKMIKLDNVISFTYYKNEQEKIKYIETILIKKGDGQ